MTDTKIETGWGIFDDERVYDQSCAHEMRIGGHSTYCMNATLPRGHCEFRYTDIATHQKCPGFQVNSAYKGQWEK